MKNIPYISWQTGGPFNFSSEDCIHFLPRRGTEALDVPKRTQDVDDYQLRLVVEISLLIGFSYIPGGAGIQPSTANYKRKLTPTPTPKKNARTSDFDTPKDVTGALSL